MLNAETPRLKFALYGAHDDLGSALLVELLSRQHEAVALLDDLNSLSARPGLRTKPGDPFDPLSVSESVADECGDLSVPRRACPAPMPSPASPPGAISTGRWKRCCSGLSVSASSGCCWSPTSRSSSDSRRSRPPCSGWPRIRSSGRWWMRPGRQPADHRDVGRSRRQGRNQSLSRAAAHRGRYRGRAGAPAAPAAHPFS